MLKGPINSLTVKGLSINYISLLSVIIFWIASLKLPPVNPSVQWARVVKGKLVGICGYK